MEKLKQLWDFLDGRKTAIGSAFFLAGHILSKFPQTAVAGEVCQEIGMYLTGVGLLHKGIKAAPATEK